MTGLLVMALAITSCGAIAIVIGVVPGNIGGLDDLPVLDPELSIPGDPELDPATDTGTSSGDGITADARPRLLFTLDGVPGDTDSGEVSQAWIASGRAYIGSQTLLTESQTSLDWRPDEPLQDGFHKFLVQHALITDRSGVRTRVSMPSNVLVVLIDSTGRFPNFPNEAPQARQSQEIETSQRAVPLTIGWNLVAWTGDGSSPLESVADAPGISRLLTYDADGQGFRSFGRTLPPAINSLETVSGGAGLWAYADRPLSWVQPITGDPQSLMLKPGFNLAAWTGPNATPVDAALSDLGEALEVAFVWDPSQGRFLTYSPSLPAALNSLTALDFGTGIWLRMSEGAFWAQPGEDGGIPSEIVVASDGSAELLIPLGALPPGVDPAEISIEPLSLSAAAGLIPGTPVLAAFDLEPSGLEFAAPAFLRTRVPFDGTGMPLPLILSQLSGSPADPINLTLDIDAVSLSIPGFQQQVVGTPFSVPIEIRQTAESMALSVDPGSRFEASEFELVGTPTQTWNLNGSFYGLGAIMPPVDEIAEQSAEAGQGAVLRTSGLFVCQERGPYAVLLDGKLETRLAVMGIRDGVEDEFETVAQTVAIQVGVVGECMLGMGGGGGGGGGGYP